MTYSILVFIFFGLSCEKPETSPILSEPTDTHREDTVLKMVWKTPLVKNTEEFLSRFAPVVYKNNVIYCAGFNGVGSVLKSSNGKTGSINWEVGVCNGPSYNPVWENFMAANCGRDVFIVDLDNGQLTWNTDIDDARPRVAIIDNYIYKTLTGPGLHYNYAHLTRTPITHQQWEVIFTLHADSLGGYRPGIESPSLWMAANGDSVLVFQNRSWNFSTSDGQIDFYAYNLSKKKIQFVLEDIEPSGNSNVMTPVVDDNRVYMLGSNHLHCIDMVHEKMSWQATYQGNSFHHVMLSNIIVEGEKIFVKTDDNYLFAYNKFSGEEIWRLNDAGSTDSYMKCHDGILYYTADVEGELMAVRASNGEIIWRETTPNKKDYPNAYFNEGLALNPGLGHIYVADNYFVMCFKLPEKK